MKAKHVLIAAALTPLIGCDPGADADVGQSSLSLPSVEILDTAGSIDSTDLTASLEANSIVGLVWEDKNSDGRFDRSLELRQEGITVYLDLNDNAALDPDEPSTETNELGLYEFTGLEPGDYTVRQEVPFGFRNVSGGRSSIDLGDPVVVSPIADVIGGDEADPDEYPFMVAVGESFGGSFFQFCGGMLISDRWVVTAGHCTDGTSPATAQVLVGTNDIFDGSGQLVNVRSLATHPDFIPFGSGDGGPESVLAGSDLALWELAQPIDLVASQMETVSLLKDADAALAADGTLATAVGWGVSDRDSTLLQDVHVPVFDTVACEATMVETFGSINFDTQICAGVPQGSVDTCQGDSGGPLLIRNRDRWFVAGITSYGEGCALPGFPGVYARVSALSDWVLETAIEPSRVHRVTVGEEPVIASFGNFFTRLQPVQTFEPRWQLLEFEPIVDEGGVAQAFEWTILDESPVSREFTCGLDFDGVGSEPDVEFACGAGVNRFDDFSAIDATFVFPSLTVSLGEDDFARASDPTFLGDVEVHVVDGALDPDDELDPDYSSSYFIDYFEIADINTDEQILIRIESDDFDIWGVLYDRDAREALGFGGELDIFTGFVGSGPAELLLDADPGVNYVIGVSTLGVEDTGSYTISVFNGGEPIEVELELDPSAASIFPQDHRKLVPIR